MSPRPPSHGDPELDLHGLTVVQAIRQASLFLVREQARGSVTVRIVTGHGTGALKTAIRDLLSYHPAVATARPALGTDAAMLVVLKPRVRPG